MTADRTLPWDWFAGTIPLNVDIDETAYVETSFSFQFMRSRLPHAVTYGRGSSSYLGTMFDVGENGRVIIGEYALVHGARIICDAEVCIGDFALLSWNVVLMDSYRVSAAASDRRKELELVASGDPRVVRSQVEAHPIMIERAVWIGFDSCVLPGVTIGEGSIIGARSVVTESVPPFTIVGGNPARVIRPLTQEERERNATEPR